MKDYLVVPATHIDLAWKKGKLEHEELLEATTVRLLDVLDHYPNYKYVIEQLEHFRVLAARRPDLVERLRNHIENGRVELVGGLASSAETNGPSGENFVRNQLLGLRSASELFGVGISSGYLIDTFGLHAQMPQVLRQFGLDRIMANRFGGVLNRDMFVVEGLNGTKMLVAGRDTNSPHVLWEKVFFAHCRTYGEIERLFDRASKADTGAAGPFMVMPYNEYDGIAITHIDRLVNEKNGAEDSARWRFATLSEFFDAQPGLDGDWPEYSADLNPEFTGTFAQRSDIRCLHRRVSAQLIEAEGWASLLGVDGWQKDFEGCWWDMAYVESHDIYTGSHPTPVWQDTIRRLKNAAATAEDLLGRCVERVASSAPSEERVIVALNSLPWTRDAVLAVELPDLPAGETLVGVRDSAGNELPFELREGSLRVRAQFSGMAATRLTLKVADSSLQPTAVAAADDQVEIGNEQVRVIAGADGVRVLFRQEPDSAPRVLRPQLTLQADTGNFQIENLTSAEVSSNVFPHQLKHLETSDLCSRLTVAGAFPGGYEQATPLAWEMEYTIYPGRPEIETLLRLDWRGKASRVRLKLGTDFSSSAGIFEIPFGTVTRQPYHSRQTARGEWPVHRWVAVEENAAGVALINRGNVGAEVLAGDISTTLLRAPTSNFAGMVPDDTSSQHGQHSFEFGILPYTGSWSDGEVLRVAQQLNSPIHCRIVSASAAVNEKPKLTLAPSSVVLSAIKRPEDGAGKEIIIRFYEATGSSTSADLDVEGAEAAWQSTLKEGRGEPAPVRDGGRLTVALEPFEIKTLRVKLR